MITIPTSDMPAMHTAAVQVASKVSQFAVEVEDSLGTLNYVFGMAVA